MYIIHPWIDVMNVSYLFLQMALLDGDQYLARKPSQQRPPQSRRRESRSKEQKAFKIRLLVLLFIFFGLYVGMETTYGGFLLTYAVRGPPKMDKVHKKSGVL